MNRITYHGRNPEFSLTFKMYMYLSMQLVILKFMDILLYKYEWGQNHYSVIISSTHRIKEE